MSIDKLSGVQAQPEQEPKHSDAKCKAAFEAYMDKFAASYWRTTGHAREAWAMWSAAVAAAREQPPAPLLKLSAGQAHAWSASLEKGYRRCLESSDKGDAETLLEIARAVGLAAGETE